MLLAAFLSSEQDTNENIWRHLCFIKRIESRYLKSFSELSRRETDLRYQGERAKKMDPEPPVLVSREMKAEEEGKVKVFPHTLDGQQDTSIIS